MFIVTQSEGWSILNGEKVETLRPIKANGKGYFKIGSIQQIFVGRNFKVPCLCRVLVYGRDFVNIHDLSIWDFGRLGYSSKAEYLAQPYNKNNPSPERVRYQFIELGQLLEFVETCKRTPRNFGKLAKYIMFSEEFKKGVCLILPWENVEMTDLESRFNRVAENIRGYMNDQ